MTASVTQSHRPVPKSISVSRGLTWRESPPAQGPGPTRCPSAGGGTAQGTPPQGPASHEALKRKHRACYLERDSGRVTFQMGDYFPVRKEMMAKPESTQMDAHRVSRISAPTLYCHSFQMGKAFPEAGWCVILQQIECRGSGQNPAVFCEARSVLRNSPREAEAGRKNRHVTWIQNASKWK
ncbi:uncharacterized protein LOC129145925 isoform X2 [Talpa occidentalis]|uniref:uncharacterized protein LOC129145925 isoform X2 n=1 Tax=Talpa occidentalis TaxID=50954 RepID=UPI0023F994C0|nr:uncharacterized protein LOC129145925 isoform X2 [Talpa occidentalis]